MPKSSFFNRAHSSSNTESESKKLITWGAAWMYGGYENDMPYFSVKVDKDDFVKMVEYSESSKDGSVFFMMFANNNQREGRRDPDYYLVPPRDHSVKRG